MHEITASAIGTIVTEVRHSITPAGISVARFRMVSQPRRFDSNAGSFVDLEASFLSVTAWRAMADHVAVSLRKGDPILVIGRLRVREWEQEGRTRTSVEIGPPPRTIVEMSSTAPMTTIAVDSTAVEPR